MLALHKLLFVLLGFKSGLVASLPNFWSSSSPEKSSPALANPAARHKVSIVVISNNRLASLQRLCTSLLSAPAHPKLDLPIIFNLEASSSPELLDFVGRFEWPNGAKTVRRRVIQGGLIRAVAEAWYPATRSEYGVFLEDDIEVSPFYAKWIVFALEAHLANPDPRLVGISLYTPRLTETVVPKEHFSAGRVALELTGDPTRPLLLQTPCSWGAMYFPGPWEGFIAYLSARFAYPNARVRIPGSTTNGWKESWKKFMFEYMWAKGLYMLYPNFSGERSFSTNHVEAGIHIGDGRHARSSEILNRFQVPLFNDTGEWRAFEARSGNSLVGKVAELPLLDVFNEPFLTAPDLEQALGRIKKRVPDRVSYDESPMRVSEWRAGTTVFATTREEDMATVSKGGFHYRARVSKEGDLNLFRTAVKRFLGRRVYTSQSSVTFPRRGTQAFDFTCSLLLNGLLVVFAHPSLDKCASRATCTSLTDLYCHPSEAQLCKGFGALGVPANCVPAPSDECANGAVKRRVLVWTSAKTGRPDPNWVATIDTRDGALVIHSKGSGLCAGALWRAPVRDSTACDEIRRRKLTSKSKAKQIAKGKHSLESLKKERAKGLKSKSSSASSSHSLSSTSSSTSSPPIELSSLWKSLVAASSPPSSSSSSSNNWRPSVHRDRLCFEHTENLARLLADPSTVTILISTFDRLHILLEQIKYYAQSPVVSRILVTWHNKAWRPPRGARIGRVLIHFISFREDSLSNRFAPHWLVTTDSLLVIDDDMRIHLHDIDLMFETWKRHRANIVGLTPRWFTTDAADGNSPKYLASSMDPPPNKKEGTPPQPGYSLSLTKVMMIHRRYLRHYSCGGGELRNTVHRVVDEHRNCEDIGFNSLVAQDRSSLGPFLGGAPPLFVVPTRHIGDYGKSSGGGLALHLRSGHLDVRTTCLKLFIEAHRKSSESLPGSLAFPVQTRVVVPEVVNESLTLLHEAPYTGWTKQTVFDCLKEEKSQSYAPATACGWIPPASYIKHRAAWAA